MGFDIQQIRKVRDPLFRQQVLRAYNYECAICGFNMRHDNASVGLEAAHIKWKQFGGPCGSRTDWRCVQFIIRRLIRIDWAG